MPHFVYKYVLNEEIIYIGKTDDELSKRLNCHGKKGDNIPEEYWDEINESDIYFARCDNSVMCDAVETALINKYKPKCNRAKTRGLQGAYSFIEPLWFYYKVATDKKVSQSIKEAKAELARIERQIETREQFIEEKENTFYDKLKKSCEECHYRKDIAILERRDALIHNREFLHSAFVTNKECEENVKTMHEIIQLYKQNQTFVYYTSKSYDSIGNLECVKSIYTDQFGNLRFSFHCAGNEDKQGSILHSPTDNTLHNYQVLKQWENKGSRNYYPDNIIKGLVN